MQRGVCHGFPQSNRRGITDCDLNAQESQLGGRITILCLTLV